MSYSPKSFFLNFSEVLKYRICNIHISIQAITLVRIPIFINVISNLYHQKIHIMTQAINANKTIMQVTAQIILIFLFFIIGFLYFLIYI